jgi:hypothetical protein
MAVTTGKTRLRIRRSEPQDAGEQRANQLAEQALRMPRAQDCQCGGTCSTCRKHPGPPRFGHDFSRVRIHPEQALRMPAHHGTVESPGVPLDADTRRFFEPRFGHDFSRVRVHHGESAGNSADAFDARAYTTGSHIVFGRGEYQPHSSEGRRLLAHELAHVIEPGKDRNTIWRQPKPAAKTPKDTVQAAIDAFNANAKTYADPKTQLDSAKFEKEINDWYATVTDTDKLIDDKLNGDVLMKRSLQSAYTAAIRALISKAATALSKTEDDLYRLNAGRIPMWAWQTPHHTEMSITSPVPQGASADPLSGDVSYSSKNGFIVKILQDGTDSKLGAEGNTTIIVTSQVPFTSTGGKIDGFTVSTPTATIQTFYGPSATRSGPSGYGRGTTAEDIAGGKVTPKSTSLSFHEGMHGLDFMQFVEANNPPQFGGTKGMTETNFKAKIAEYQAALKAYGEKATAFSSKRTHCVGTTIDQYNKANAAVGAKIKLECKP